MLTPEKMNIAFDILHIAYWNFYKNIVNALERRSCQVYIFVRERGPLLEIIKKEYNQHQNIIITGKYYKGKKKLLLHLFRVPVLVYYLIKYKIQVVSSDGFFIGLAAKIVKIPAIMHSDDYEYRFSYKMTQLFSSKMIIPNVFPITSKKDIHYKGCKEWAYLSKKYFEPNREALPKLLQIDAPYVFLRLISKSSLNYIGKKNIDDIVFEIIHFLNDRDINVLISSEEEFTENLPKNCVILKPPIRGFHSILNYALAVITEGDTMAREAAVLNTPVVYMGGRTMKIHKYFLNTDCFIETSEPKKIEMFINKVLVSNKTSALVETFDDINQLMVEHIIGEPGS